MKEMICGCNENKPCDDHQRDNGYRPRATKYLVQWSNGMLGGLERADVLSIELNLNRKDGNPAHVIWQLYCTLPTLYRQVSEDSIREVALPPTLSCDNPAASFV